MINYSNIKIAQGTLTTSNATLATCAKGTKLIIKEVVIANTTVNDITVNFSFNGIVLVGTRKVFANDTIIISLNLLIDATDTAQLIQGFAATANACNYYMSGILITETLD